MCCRYWADESPEIREIVEEMNKSPLVDKWQRITGITTYGEIRPTNVVPVIVENPRIYIANSCPKENAEE